MAGRRYQNGYSATIATASVAAGDLVFDVSVAPGALAAGEYYHLTLTDSLDPALVTKTEIVKCSGISGVQLTVERAQEGTSAETWVSGNFVEIRVTDESLEKLDNPLLNDYTEQTGSGAGTVIQSSGQLIWERTLTANTTFTDGLNNGQQITMHLYNGASWSVIWPAVTWVGGVEPTLTAADVIVWWKTGGVLYASYAGSIA